MLSNLTIRDFAIVDSMGLEFDKGFSVMTGETGAGKSILIDALELVLGARSDATVIREGAKKTDISAEFLITPSAKDWLIEHDIDSEEGTILLRRTVDQAGRSKGFINGVPVTVTQLRELGEVLIDIHGQHANQSLLRSKGQRELFDRHAGLEDDTKAVSQLYKTWKNLEEKVKEANQNAKAIQEKKERLSYQFEELDQLAPKEGEWEEINAQFSKLSNVASLMEATTQSYQEISEADLSILSRIYAVKQKIERVLESDADLKPLHELIESAHIQLQEAAYLLSDYMSQMDLDPSQLEQVEERMSALYGTARKFHVAPEELFKERGRLKAELDEIELFENSEALLKKTKEAEKAYFDKAKKLSQKRAKAAKNLEKTVTQVMADLSMKGSSFFVQLNASEPTSYGLENIEFLVSGHENATPRPLTKVASGGELARISLAISVITSQASETPTLIFDEVDSGIGGGVAEVVGTLLRKLGDSRQVLCVTHLPQVASQATNHFQVSKEKTDQAQVSHVKILNENERIEEISRMLGGISITETTRQHAKEMLKII